VSDGSQQLSTALIEQRTAIEPPPGSAGNEWELRRSATVDLSITARDLTYLGPEQVQPRELVGASAAGVALNFGVLCISHPSGYWILGIRNRGALAIQVEQFNDLGQVLALAGWATTGSFIRAGWRQDPLFAYLGGITTAARPFGYQIPANFNLSFSRPLWVEPGRVFSINNPTIASTIVVEFDVLAPITRGIGT